MKDYKEMADSVLDRVHEYQQQEQSKKAKIRTFGRTAAIALPVIAVAAVGIFALTRGIGGSKTDKHRCCRPSEGGLRGWHQPHT